MAPPLGPLTPRIPTTAERNLMSPERDTQEPSAEETEAAPEMCCDGQQTAEAHRHESPDGKCCVDT